MKKLIYILSVFSIFCSCNYSPFDKPQNLLTKDELAEIIADFAIYEQSYLVSPESNMEEVHLYVLRKHKITVDNLKNSYTYYSNNIDDINYIYDKAKDIILSKDDKAKEYIEKNKISVTENNQ